MSNAVAPVGAALPAIPAFIQAAAAAAGGINEDLKSGINAGMLMPTRLSIRGKLFRIMKDGNEFPLLKKNDEGEDEPVQSLNVVIIAANKGLHKLFYTKKYNPEADDAVAPDCYSYDGVAPSPMAANKQCETCAACPQNVWGSKITEQGNKTRACSDNKLLAVMATGGVTKRLGPDNLFGEMIQVKVTPGALNRSKEDRKADPQHPYSWMEFVNLINEYPMGNGETKAVPVRAVSVKLFFDAQAAYPQLRFKIQRWLTADEYAFANERADGEDVQHCITETMEAAPAPAKLAAPKPKPDADDDDLPDAGGAAPAVIAAPKPAAATKAATTKAPTRKAAIDPETGEIAPIAATKARTTREAKAAQNPPPAEPTSSELDDDLAAIVGQFS